MPPTDRYLPLNSDALVLADGSELDGSRTEGRPLLDERTPGPAWLAATARGAFAAARLPRAGHAAVIRVVTPGDDAPTEAPVATASAPLTLPTGRLLLCGSQDVLRGELDDESIREVTVPAGSYRATLELQVAAASTLPLLRAAADAAGSEPERLGAYFRRTRPGDEPPDWLAYFLAERPHHDPGHEDAWEEFQETDRFGELVDAAEGAGLPFVDLVLRLEPDAPCDPPTSGWLDLAASASLPPVCPLGLRTSAI